MTQLFSQLAEWAPALMWGMGIVMAMVIAAHVWEKIDERKDGK